MARRRCLSLDVIDTDQFLELPLSTQALYMHLVCRADDDGFIGNPRKITKMLGANENDLDELQKAKYVTCFDSGVLYVNHFKKMNTIQKDRYNRTIYLKELKSFDELSNQKLSEYGFFEDTGNLYVIQSDKKLCKIGVSQKPKTRFSQIKTFEEIDILKIYLTDKCYNRRELEKTAHEHFANKRVSGEWFDVPFDEAVTYIKNMFREKAKI